MKRIHILLLLITFGLSSFHTRAQEQGPNVLFLAIDDLNDWLGCMGDTQAITPNIDKLVKGGMLFKNAHCQAPICAPSRASILTGLSPTTTGFYLMGKDTIIKKASPTSAKALFMPEWFEKYGYKTMGSGKILHNANMSGAFQDYNKMGGSPKPKKRMKWPAEGFPKKGTGTDWGPYGKDEDMQDFKTAEYAVKMLKQKHKKPFFLAAGFYRPHVPWHVPQKWFDMYPIENIKTPAYKKDDLDDVPEIAKRIAHLPMMPTTEWAIENGEWKNIVQAYLACITFVDAQVGKIMDTLEKSEYANNTIVVLWSDHGYHLGEKNRFSKQAIWERNTRTILAFNGPGITSNKTCDAPVQLLDMYPTLTDLCGIPSNTLNEGHSLVPLLKNPKAKWNHLAYTSYGQGNITLRSKTHRYIVYEDGSEELYDMIKDPNEWHNLANDSKYNKLKREFKAAVPQNQAPLSAVSGYWANEYWRKKTNEARKEK